MKKLLLGLLLVTASENVFAGKTVRNTPDDGDARRRAAKAWETEGSKKAANIASKTPTKKAAVKVVAARATQTTKSN